VSSHDLDLLLKYCQKILVMGSGKAVLMNVSEAREHSTFREIAGGFL
jgi:ABC-type phosphate/phosphonate transport system ATPase subunit